MNPTERFFAKLRKLTVQLETESQSLLHTCQNGKEVDDDVEESQGAEVLYQIHSEVRALKRQVQDQVAKHDSSSTELRGFIKRCLVLKQRTTEDIDRLKKHYEKYGYRAREDKTTVCVDQRKPDAEKTDAEQEEENGADQSETPEKIPPPVDPLLTPKLSDFGLTAVHFQELLRDGETSHSVSRGPDVVSPPPFVLKEHPKQPKTPKCSLNMEEDAPTPRLEDFGISENTMCWNNDFTMDLFNKKPPKVNSETPSTVLQTVARESLDSPELPVFCTPGLKIEKQRTPSSPPLKSLENLNDTLLMPETPTFESDLVSKLMKKDTKTNRSQGGSSSIITPEIVKIQSYDYEELSPELPVLQSAFGASLAKTNRPGETLSYMETHVSASEDKNWCLSSPKVRKSFSPEPCTPETPDVSTVTRDILKLCQ